MSMSMFDDLRFQETQQQTTSRLYCGKLNHTPSPKKGANIHPQEFYHWFTSLPQCTCIDVIIQSCHPQAVASFADIGATIGPQRF